MIKFLVHTLEIGTSRQCILARCLATSRLIIGFLSSCVCKDGAWRKNRFQSKIEQSPSHGKTNRNVFFEPTPGKNAVQFGPQFPIRKECKNHALHDDIVECSVAVNLGVMENVKTYAMPTYLSVNAKQDLGRFCCFG